MFVTPSLDFASSRLWWTVALLGLVDEHLLVQYWQTQFLSPRMESSTAHLLHSIVPNVVSILPEIVEISRIDDRHVDDSPHHLCSSFMNQRVSLSFECLS